MENEKKNMQSTEVTNVNKNELLNFDKFNSLNDTTNDEFVGVDITLDKITMPTGGNTTFQVSLNGDTTDEKELLGVILYNHPAYSYYKNQYNGDKTPPDCFSIDGKYGKGDPGGACIRCPYNNYGSGNDGVSKACKNKRVLYFLIAGVAFPYIVYLPAGSIANYNQFAKNLISIGAKPSQVLVKINLTKATSKNGIAYSKANFQVQRFLTEEEQQTIKPVIQFVKDYASNRSDTIINESNEEGVMDGFTNMEQSTEDK